MARAPGPGSGQRVETYRFTTDGAPTRGIGCNQAGLQMSPSRKFRPFQRRRALLRVQGWKSEVRGSTRAEQAPADAPRDGRRGRRRCFRRGRARRAADHPVDHGDRRGRHAARRRDCHLDGGSGSADVRRGRGDCPNDGRGCDGVGDPRERRRDAGGVDDGDTDESGRREHRLADDAGRRGHGDERHPDGRGTTGTASNRDRGTDDVPAVAAGDVRRAGATGDAPR